MSALARSWSSPSTRERGTGFSRARRIIGRSVVIRKFGGAVAGSVSRSRTSVATSSVAKASNAPADTARPATGNGSSVEESSVARSGTVVSPKSRT